MSFTFELVKAFVEIAKDLRPDYIENWLDGKVSNSDMENMLSDEKRCRLSTYLRLANEIQSRHSA